MVVIWQGCYDQGWGKNLVAEAYSHPAKVSFKLADHIYAHAIQEGWISSGSKIVDPFGGIGGFAFHALWHGMNFTGIELESRFVSLGQQNIDLWQRKYGSKEGFGSARIIQGDSRKLAEVIVGADCCIGSPPYAESIGTKDQKFWDNHNDRQRNWRGATRVIQDYGSSPGQLGSMKEGDFDCVVGSPPFSTAETRDRTSYSGGWIGAMMKNAYTQNKQGQTKDQLASLPEGRFEAVISSPPYEGSLDAKGDGIDWTKAQRGGHSKESGTPRSLSRGAIADGYGAGRDNLGNSAGDTFWQAAREILIQCHAVLKPGGHAIWVVKNFVRQKKLVDFEGNWQRLCESVGFVTVCKHRAMLTQTYGTQIQLDGTDLIKTIKMASFFRRLAESKGSPSIDWEMVLCTQKPVKRA